ncbi:hypothetical protein STEG23_019702, partial [Scotinomys teguina]
QGHILNVTMKPIQVSFELGIPPQPSEYSDGDDMPGFAGCKQVNDVRCTRVLHHHLLGHFQKQIISNPVPVVGEDSIGPPGAGVTDSCELPCGCWELNLDPLEEQPVLFTSEPSAAFLSSQLSTLPELHCLSLNSRVGNLLVVVEGEGTPRIHMAGRESSAKGIVSSQRRDQMPCGQHRTIPGGCHSRAPLMVRFQEKLARVGSLLLLHGSQIGTQALMLGKAVFTNGVIAPGRM